VFSKFGHFSVNKLGVFTLFSYFWARLPGWASQNCETLGVKRQFWH